MKEILQGKDTHPLVVHFKEQHQGQNQEILFRVLGHFQTALARQVWESVEIDNTTAILGHNGCLNSKTEWGASKDPTLVPRQSPLRKDPQKTHNKDQTPTETAKRSRPITTAHQGLEVDPRPPKRARLHQVPQNNQTRDQTPIRSRWHQWQERISPTQQPTQQSGLQGPEVRFARGRTSSSQSYGGREGLQGPTQGPPNPRTPGGGGNPPHAGEKVKESNKRTQPVLPKQKARTRINGGAAEKRDV